MIIALTANTIKAKAFSFNVVTADEVPWMQSQVAQTINALNSQSDHTDNYYIIISFSSSSSYVAAKVSFPTDDTVTITNDYWGSCSPRYTIMHRIGNSNYPANVSTTNWNSSQVVNGFSSNSNYIVEYTVPIQFNGQTIEPESYKDDLYVTKDGNSIKFGVSATINSRFENTYFYSDGYTADFIIDRNSVSYTVSPTSYAYYNVGLSTNIVQSDSESTYFYQDTPYMTYYKYMRSVKVSKYEYIAENPPTAESLIRNGVTFTSENVVTLNTLLTEYQKQQPEFTVQDMQTQIVVKLKNSKGKVVLEKALNFAPLAGTQAVTELPPDEAGTPNQFDPYKELNDNLSSNNYYLQSLLYGDTYLSQGMSEILIYNKDDLNPFDMPEFELENPDFDTNTMSWFRRVVTWWYETPFGFIALAALTFLIIRTIVW